MSELTGAEWLNSPENRAYERRVLRPFIPFIIAGSAIAKTGVRLFESDSHPVKQAERALIPGHIYQIEKIGDPTSSRRFSQLLAKTMLDELPQLRAIQRGTVALVGPRGTLPEHRERLFDVLGNNKAVDDWRHILAQQKHGLLSSYALEAHSRSDKEITETLRTDSQVAAEALIRYEADKRDFTDASHAHSQKLVRGFTDMVRQKIMPE